MSPEGSLHVPIRRITALAPDPRRPGAVKVQVDGQPFCTVPGDVAAQLGLVVGRTLEGPLEATLQAAADAEAAFRTVLRALEVRSYARADLGRRLVRKGHPREAVDLALEKAAGLGLLDDAAFARGYVETRAARGRGPSRLAADLARMGVARSHVDAALAAQFPPDEDHTALPRALAEKRARQLGALPKPMKKRRLLAYLARRGFAGREISEMVSRLV